MSQSNSAKLTNNGGSRVYVDDAFVDGDWGKWSGGGHLQADTPEALHDFAAKIGLRRDWFQHRPGRPERDHYDVTRSKRDEAILAGAIPERTEDGTQRRRAARQTSNPPQDGSQ